MFGVAALEGDPIEAVRNIVMSASYMVLGLGDVYLGAPCAVPVDPRHRCTGKLVSNSSTLY